MLACGYFGAELSRGLNYITDMVIESERQRPGTRLSAGEVSESLSRVMH